MNKQLILLGFSLLSWGWLVQNLWVAIGLFFIIAAIQSNSWRWTISTKNLNRWGDAATFLVVVLLLDVYLLQPAEQPMFVLLKCLPVLVLPVLLAQLLSQQSQIPLSVLFYSLRKKNRAPQSIDFQLPYTALVMLSAGAANVQDDSYFIVSSLLFIAVLWTVRPKQSRLWLWLPVIALAAAISYFGQQGLHQLHKIVEQKSIQWLSEWNADPFKNQTSIGDIGELKLSNRIEFRLKADGQLLLHQASYDLYLGQSWIASKRIFTGKPPVMATESALRQLTVLQHDLAHTVLALPDGTENIKGLEDAILQYTELGTIEVDTQPRSANYEVFYTGKRLGKPSQYDLQIPKQHQDWLQTVSTQLKLTGLPPKVAAERIKDYFQQHFFYTLYLGTESDANNALRDFMLKRKAGHCEYFAAATVFLLRQSGIPARLATGYSVTEYLPEQDLYLVRRRDAHAWATAYIDGVWQPVDSTPSQWQQLEAENAEGILQTLSDSWSNMVFLWQQWQPSDTLRLQLKSLALLLLGSYLLTRGIIRHRQKTRELTSNAETKPLCNGLDSEFYALEQQLQNTPQARIANESLQQWVQRLNHPELISLCQLHYQLRFDPQGLSNEQRQQLRQQVQTWLVNSN